PRPRGPERPPRERGRFGGFCVPEVRLADADEATDLRQVHPGPLLVLVPASLLDERLRAVLLVYRPPALLGPLLAQDAPAERVPRLHLDPADPELTDPRRHLVGARPTKRDHEDPVRSDARVHERDDALHCGGSFSATCPGVNRERS